MRWAIAADPQHELVDSALVELRSRFDRVFITTQVLVEFQALATRPLSANGLGIAPAVALNHARRMENSFELLPETFFSHRVWRRLVASHQIVGRQVYDTRLVSVMLASSITHLLTLDPADFRRFKEITVVTPQQIVAAA